MPAHSGISDSSGSAVARHNEWVTAHVDGGAESAPSRSFGAQSAASRTLGGRRKVLVLGSTGSIGTQALEVIAPNPDRFELVGLAAGRAHPDLLAQQRSQTGVS